MQRGSSNLVSGIVFTLLGTGALLSSCATTQTTCDDGIGCVTGTAGHGGDTGASGKTGAGGGAQGGSSAGKSGSPTGGTRDTGGGTSSGGGEGPGAAGAGGGGTVTLPCDGACAAPKAVCDAPRDTCVECLKEQDCTGAKKKCDTTATACVECLAPADCSTAAAARCDAGACIKCTTNDDCTHIAGKGVCDTKAGECVPCTGKDYAACGSDTGTPLVCDSKARTCTSKKQRSSGLCQSCVSDAQCKLGQLCVQEKFGNAPKDVGYFCFWKKAAGEGGAPADCETLGRPYAKTLANQSSIDGTMADVCGLRSSTCIARNQFSSKDCATASAPDDQKCGFAPGEDSKCASFGVGYRCTTTCLSSDDCDSGVTCDTGASPKVCAL